MTASEAKAASQPASPPGDQAGRRASHARQPRIAVNTYTSAPEATARQYASQPANQGRQPGLSASQLGQRGQAAHNAGQADSEPAMWQPARRDQAIHDASPACWESLHASRRGQGSHTKVLHLVSSQAARGSSQQPASQGQQPASQQPVGSSQPPASQPGAEASQPQHAAASQQPASHAIALAARGSVRESCGQGFPDRSPGIQNFRKGGFRASGS